MKKYTFIFIVFLLLMPPSASAFNAFGFNNSSGSAATDPLWDAAGDTLYGTGSDTGARLAKGTAYQIYNMNSGATAPAWTSTLGATGTRLTKGWFTDLEITNAPTINGAAWTTILQAAHAALASISGLTETNGGIPYGTADNAYAWLAAGATGKVLIGKGAAAPEWTPYTFPATVPTVGKVLISDGTNLIGSTALGTGAYATIANYLPLSTIAAAGDVIVGSGAGAVTVITKGAINSILGVNGAGTLGYYTSISIDDSAAQFYSATASKGTLKNLLSGSTSGKLLTVSWNHTDNKTLNFPDPTTNDSVTYGSAPIRINTGGTTARVITAPDANVTIPANPIGGTLGATTNIIPKASGTGTATLQASGITEDGTNVDIGALNMVTTGTITGKMKIITDDITLSATQVLGHVIVMSGAAETATLPAAVVGMNVLFYASGAGVKNIDPNGTDTIVLTTAALTAGYQIESPGAVGDFIAMVCLTANQWTCMGRSGVWVTHGAD